MCPLAASAGSRCFSRLAWYPRAARSRRAATASARTSRNRRVCVRASRLEPDDLPGRLAPDRGCLLLACLSPTHLFRSPADRLTRSPPAHLQISWLSPPKGSVSGGTVLSVYGSGFKRSPVAKVRPRSPSRVQIARARRNTRRSTDRRTIHPLRPLARSVSNHLSLVKNPRSVASPPKTSSTRWSWCTSATARAGA